ncbi:MAG: ABC transporter permease [Gemmatales bacterium]|nr:MAG: ABC transporter permease [Gemmatales bacterium]GIX00477.1 MAG: ABC transporter permease [Pirellulaceae bacterium]
MSQANSPRRRYSKPWLSHADQVQRLQQRGLVVADTAAAQQFLRHVGYYRLSGYCLAFESARHCFIPGTTFEQIAAAYQFDLILRDLVTEALEVIELDLRSGIAHHFGRRHGPFGHTDEANFFDKFDHSRWLERLRDEAGRSSELFVEHFKNNYSDFPDLPIWIATEIMSFGGLSTFFKWMTRNDQQAIAGQYNLQSRILQSWMHHLVYIRNLCAHHSRLWDRVWAIKPTLPRGKNWQPPAVRSNRHLLATLLLLRYCLKRIPTVARFAHNWKSRVEARLAQPPHVANADSRMGLTSNWQTNPIWR